MISQTRKAVDCFVKPREGTYVQKSAAAKQERQHKQQTRVCSFET